MFERGNIITEKKGLKRTDQNALSLFFCFFWEVGWVCSTFIYGDLIGLAIFHTLVEIYLVFKVCLSPYSCWGQTV